jgi:hypothetical protein
MLHSICRSGHLAAALVGVASVLAGCSSADRPTPPKPAVSAIATSQPGLVTVTGKASRGTVVVLEPIEPAPSEPPPPAIVDQRAQQFIPDLLVVRTGQTVEFRNSESTPHNVYVTRAASGAEELNVSTDPGQAHGHVFAEAGLYEVSCDIHESMRASIVVVSSSYYAVAGDFGRYVIMNVPPGRYRLQSIHGADSSLRLVELAGEQAVVDVTGR